jgi:hypothetical protein
MTEFEYTYDYVDLMGNVMNVTITVTKLDNQSPCNSWQMKQKNKSGKFSEQRTYVISKDEAKKLYQFANKSNGKDVAFQSASWKNVKLQYSK